jgi:hypothetical protein
LPKTQGGEKREMPSVKEIKEKLGDYNVLLKHMEFLQNNGFSDYGRGHIVGQMEILEEYLKESGKNQEEAAVDIQALKSKNIKETMVVADKNKGNEEQGIGSRRMVADITYEKGKITISKEDSNNRIANNNSNTNYYNESNVDPSERKRTQLIKSEYSKRTDNDNIMNNKLLSQKENQIAQVLYSPSNSNTVNEDSNNHNKVREREVHDLVEGNKVIKQSWRDKIKGMANNIEDWR